MEEGKNWSSEVEKNSPLHFYEKKKNCCTTAVVDLNLSHDS